MIYWSVIPLSVLRTLLDELCLQLFEKLIVA
jgi:hypothetical protein